jgi:PAS domain S-box-containing protein
MGVVCASLAQPLPPVEVTTFRQLGDLPREEAAKGWPVRFDGVVVCYDREWGQLYVHDGTRVQYFSPQTFPQQLEAGQHVGITGATALVENYAGLTSLHLTVLGKRALPAATRLKVSQLASDFGQWVETSGRVRRADTSRGRLGLTLHDQGQSCLVYVMGPSGAYDFKHLLDCEVRVQGINASRIVNGRLEAASVFASGTNTVTILGAPAEAPAALPVVAIDTLLNRELGDWTNRLVHLNGLITAYKPGESVVIRDPTGVLRAEVIQITRAQSDERVDLWGFLTVSPTETVLTDAHFEVTRPPAAAAALRSPVEGFSVPTNWPKLLTDVPDILRLPREVLAQRIPVKLRGVITYADPEFHNGFLQQGEHAIYLDLAQKAVRAGQWVEVNGVTDAGGFAPQINEVRVTILGTTNLPSPVKVTLDDLADGALDSRWIEMRGVIRRAEIEWGHLYLSLTTRKGKFKAVLPGIGGSAATTGLVDALVSIQGACGSGLNSRGQLSGITLHVPGLDQILPLDPIPSDPFAAQITPIAAVSTYDAARLAGRRVKVAGIVTLSAPQSGFFLQDSSGGIRVSTQQTNTPHVGDAVEVLGFPALGDYSPRLEEAAFRQVGVGTTPVPQKTTAEEILLRGRHDGQVVELEARLVQSVPRSAQPKLVLQDGPVIFTAQLTGQLPERALQRLQPGSVLRLTGVCLIQGGAQHEPETFRLLLARSPDVRLIRAPAWWSMRHTLLLAGGLLLVIGLALAWVSSLRRQVHAQTEVIHQKLEEGKEFAETLAREKNLLATLIDHLPDHVFVKDTAGHFLLANRAHAQFHGIPSPEMSLEQAATAPTTPSRSPAVTETDRQVWQEGAGVFNVEELAKDQAGEPHWLSTTKVPLRDGAGAIIGLVGISHDVTERKRDEAELAAMHKQLVITSHQAGMAEVATNVLHNVGNVLNSVNVSAGVIFERMRESRVRNLTRLATLLAEHEPDLATFLTHDPRGRQIPAYLKHLAEHLDGEQAGLIQEIESLTRNIEHIKEIVAMQQSYARVGGVVERVAATDLVEDALHMNIGALERHQVRMVREFPSGVSPTISVERHKVLQILVNLIRNAKYACDESGRPDKQVTVRVSPVDDRVRIAIVDNGVGIPPENMMRIFNHGFSTRQGGHGFGLHGAALAAKDLGGSLHAHSAGPGQGATFILELPRAVARA